METRHIVVSSISEYIDAVNQFRKKANITETILFRGQSDVSWKIKSSLERTKLPNISFYEYYTSIDFYKPEINAYGKNFERKASFSKGYDFDFSDYDGIKFSQFPELEYLTYLRHHGFPSPLIDFSKSEYSIEQVPSSLIAREQTFLVFSIFSSIKTLIIFFSLSFFIANIEGHVLE